jgi:hypothetical protein
MPEGNISFKELELKESAFGDLMISTRELDLGTEPSDEKAISVKDLHIRLGDRPVARNLRKLYEKAGKELPPDIAVFDRYKIWLLTHSIGAINIKGNSYPKILSLGYEANFEDAENVYTVELLPRTKFVTKFVAESKIEVGLGLEGHAQVPEAITQLLEQVEYLGADAHLKLAADNKLVGQLSFSIMTPTIQAIGIGSSQCQWLFEVEDKPLLGDQIMLQTILVPKKLKQLVYNIRGYALIKSSFVSFPAKFHTEWVKITCDLV